MNPPDVPHHKRGDLSDNSRTLLTRQRQEPNRVRYQAPRDPQVQGMPLSMVEDASVGTRQEGNSTTSPCQ